MSPRSRRPRLIIAAAACTAGLASFTNHAVRATNYTWTATAAAGGTFSTAASWSPLGPPTLGTDAALFNSANTYPVTLSANGTVGSATASAGTITLLSSAGSQKSLTLSSAATASSITGPTTLNLGTVNNPVTLNANTLTLNAGATVNAKFGSDVSLATLNVGNAASPTYTPFTVDGSGSTLAASAGINLGFAGSYGALVVQNAAAATLTGTGIVVGDATGNGQLKVQGSASLTTPSLAVGVANNPTTGNGYLLVDNAATLTVTGAGTVTVGSPTGLTADFYVFNSTLNTGTGLTFFDKTASVSTSGTTALNVNGDLTFRGAAATFNPNTLHLANGKTFSASNAANVTFYNGYTTPANSTFQIDAAYLSTQEINPGDGSTFAVGANSTVNLNNGAILSPRNLLIGNGSPNATVILDGASSLNVPPGSFGSSQIGTLGGSGSLALKHGSSATFGSALLIGEGGTNDSGLLNINSASSATIHELYLGTSSYGGSTGYVNVSDTGSTLTIQTDLYAGNHYSTSNLAVYTGASLVQGTGVTNTPIPAQIGTGGGNAFFSTGFTLQISGGSVALGNLIAPEANTIQLNSGSLGFVGSLLVDPTGPMGPSVVLSYGSNLAMTGPVTINPNSNLTLAGGALSTQSITNNGSLNFLAGTLAINGPSGITVGSAGPLGTSLNLSAGKTLLVANATSVSPGSTLNLSGGALTTNALSSDGQITVNNFSSLTVNNGLTNTSNGRLFIGADLTATVNGPSSNSGRITFQNDSGRLLGTGTLTNTGLITGSGELAKPLVNAAAGELRADPAQLLLFSGPLAASNAGKINLQGGTVEFAVPLNNSATGVISGHGTLISSSLANSGQISLAGGDADVRGPVTNSNKILVTGGATATFYNPFTNNPGANVFTAANSAVVFLAPVSGTGTYTGTGTKYFSDGSSTTAALESSGITVVDEPASLSTPDFIEQSVTANGHIATPDSSLGGNTSKINALAIGPTGSFDLADNKLILDYTGAAPLAQLRQYLLANQLTSSTANADPLHRLAIGYIDNTLLNTTTWGGLSADPTSLLTKLTYLGDANLDGKITPDDYALLDKGFAQHLSTWTFGDFNYDGQVTSADYLLIDRVLIQQTGVLSPSLLAEREAQFGADYVSQLIAAAPEPSSALACGFAIPLFLRRRRNYRKLHH